MRKFIKKNLLPFLFNSYILFGYIGLYTLINQLAAAERGYNYALGIEDILFIIPFIILTLKKTYKIISGRKKTK